MRIAIASDHAGFRLKTTLIDHLAAGGHDITDLGTDSEAPVDYPPLCAAAARHVVHGDADFAIVLGGSGQGEAIAANKVRGARAALCHDEYTARLSRAHNNANVLSLGGRILAPEFAIAILEVFLTTPFEGGRHIPRLLEISAIEDDEAAAPSGTATE
jgi:ribose 5-phosphate isomerase B